MYSTTLHDTPFEVAGRWLKRARHATRSTIDGRFGAQGSRNLTPAKFALNACAPGRYVLKLGRGHGEVARELKRKLCHVTSIDLGVSNRTKKTSPESTPTRPRLPDNVAWFDEILLLDLIDQIAAPDVFMKELRRKMARRGSEVVITSANFVSLIRRMLLGLGGVRRTIVVRSKNEPRPFTFKSLRVLLQAAGYEIIETRGIPMAALATGETNRWNRAFVKLNRGLAKVSKHFFAHHICVRARPLAPTRPSSTEDSSGPAELYPKPIKRVA
ncbi:MAG TPA: methyltransferase domain-containing protein [Chthoniobacterales bacterium]